MYDKSPCCGAKVLKKEVNNHEVIKMAYVCSKCFEVL
jgi:hypothetical protein